MTAILSRTAVNALTRSRILAMLQEPSDAIDLASRDILLPELLLILAGDHADVGADEIADAARSVTFAAVDESLEEHLSALLVGSQVLIRQGDFARAEAADEILLTIGIMLGERRPFLATTLRALATFLRSGREAARAPLENSLGIGTNAAAPKMPNHSLHVSDVLISHAFWRWLVHGDLGGAERARPFALRSNNTLGFAVIELVAAIAQASREYSLASSVQNATNGFAATNSDELFRVLPERLFPAQKQAIEEGLLGGGATVVAIPTGTGKTLLAALRVAVESRRLLGHRTLYIAPYRLLAHQVERMLGDWLRPSRISVRDLGGHFDLDPRDPFRGQALPDVAIMTPERLDGLMRLAGTDLPGASRAIDFLRTLRLVVFDEAHVLGSRGRGVRAELILTRLRQLCPEAVMMPMTGASRGVELLSAWIGGRTVGLGSRPATTAVEMHWRSNGDIVRRLAGGQPELIARMARTGTLYANAARLAHRFAQVRGPILILETQRGYAESVAIEYAKDVRAGELFVAELEPTGRERLAEAAALADEMFGVDSRLGRLLRQGVAFHHAGIPSNILRSIEGLANARLLRLVATTTTVAEGADLPFQVVILPHITFVDQPMEVTLYRNIVGRAGRPHVSHEGIVIALGSPSRNLSRYVENTLWRESPAISGRLAKVQSGATTRTAYFEHRSLQSQVLAWIGEEGSFTEDQDIALAQRTFSWTNPNTRERVRSRVASVLADLEQRQFVARGSPFQLTPSGRRARIAGLSPASCKRIEVAIDATALASVVRQVSASYQIDATAAQGIARAVLETEEVLTRGLWFGRLGGREFQRMSLLREMNFGQREWPYENELYVIDVRVIAGWLLGATAEDMQTWIPRFQHGGFSSDDTGTRTADLHAHIVDVMPTAAWAWSGVLAVTDLLSDAPYWIRRAIDRGVPTETATELIDEVRLSRQGAIRFSVNLPAHWPFARDALLRGEVHATEGLTGADERAFRRWAATDREGIGEA